MLPRDMLLMISQRHLPSPTLMELLMTTPRLPSMPKKPMTVLEPQLDHTLLLSPTAVPRLSTITPMTMMDTLLRLLMKEPLYTQRQLLTQLLILLLTQLLMPLPTQLLMLLHTQLPLLLH